MSTSPYTALVVCPSPPVEDNSHIGRFEVWNQYTETHPKMGTFESDGIIGWLHDLKTAWVFVNEYGYPTMAFLTREDMIGWLQSRAETIRWDEKPR